MDSLDAFFAGLSRAPVRLLLLDYDGTLAPFVIERDRAAPYPGVRGALARLGEAGRTRVVIISGRAADDVAALLDLAPPPEIWGCHGWERRAPGGATRTVPLPDPACQALDAGRRALAAVGLADRCEVKPAGLAVHWRGLPRAEAARVAAAAREALAPLVATGDTRLDPFDGGLELRPAGRDKGSVVRDLLAEAGAGAAVAYLGDDRTDEDAFRALDGVGLPVLVAGVPRPTAAALRLRPPGELLAFLARWERAVAGGEGPR